MWLREKMSKHCVWYSRQSGTLHSDAPDSRQNFIEDNLALSLRISMKWVICMFLCLELSICFQRQFEKCSLSIVTSIDLTFSRLNFLDGLQPKLFNHQNVQNHLLHPNLLFRAVTNSPLVGYRVSRGINLRFNLISQDGTLKICLWGPE